MKDFSKHIHFFPGSFKPFHDGHLAMILSMAEGDDDQCLVVVSSKDRDGLTAESSLSFINTVLSTASEKFNKALHIKPFISKKKSPVGDCYNIAHASILNDEGKDFNLIRSPKNEDDEMTNDFAAQIKKFCKDKKKHYAIAKIDAEIPVVNYEAGRHKGEPISSRFARQAVLDNDYDEFKQNYSRMLANELISPKDLRAYFNTLRKEINDEIEVLKESVQPNKYVRKLETQNQQRYMAIRINESHHSSELIKINVTKINNICDVDVDTMLDELEHIAKVTVKTAYAGEYGDEADEGDVIAFVKGDPEEIMNFFNDWDVDGDTIIQNMYESKNTSAVRNHRVNEKALFDNCNSEDTDKEMKVLDIVNKCGFTYGAPEKNGFRPITYKGDLPKYGRNQDRMYVCSCGSCIIVGDEKVQCSSIEDFDKKLKAVVKVGKNQIHESLQKISNKMRFDKVNYNVNEDALFGRPVDDDQYLYDDGDDYLTDEDEIDLEDPEFAYNSDEDDQYLSDESDVEFIDDILDDSLFESRVTKPFGYNKRNSSRKSNGMVMLSEALKSDDPKIQKKLAKSEQIINDVINDIKDKSADELDSKTLKNAYKKLKKEVEFVKSTGCDPKKIKNLKTVMKKIAKEEPAVMELTESEFANLWQKARVEKAMTLHDNVKVNGKPLKECSTKEVKRMLSSTKEKLSSLREDNDICINEGLAPTAEKRSKVLESISKYKKLLKFLSEEIDYRYVMNKRYGKLNEEDEEQNDDTQIPDAPDSSAEDPDEDQEVELSGIVFTMKDKTSADEFIDACVDSGVPREALEIIEDENDDNDKDDDSAKNESHSVISKKFRALLEDDEAASTEDASTDDSESSEENSDETSDDDTADSEPVKVRLVDTDYTEQVAQVLDDVYGMSKEEFEEKLGGEIVSGSDEESDDDDIDPDKLSADDLFKDL